MSFRGQRVEWMCLLCRKDWWVGDRWLKSGRSECDDAPVVTNTHAQVKAKLRRKYEGSERVMSKIISSELPIIYTTYATCRCTWASAVPLRPASGSHSPHSRVGVWQSYRCRHCRIAATQLPRCMEVDFMVSRLFSAQRSMGAIASHPLWWVR
jgi:hypothetical protein